MQDKLYKTRSFNKINELLDGTVLEKRSTEIDKLSSEYRYYYACNAIMQRYIVRPFSFKLDGAEASYKMNKVNGDDLGLLYANDELTGYQLKFFLDHFDIFRRSENPKHINYEDSYNLVVKKSRDRITGMYGGTLPKDREHLITRLSLAFDHYDTYRGNRLARPSHGDPCFSNIIITKDGQLKMFDPKGIDFFYMDEYYDIAKISQSLMSGYDLIVHDKQVPEPKFQGMFEKYLNTININFGLLRVYEASLFISMCPMHQDNPDHVEKFFNVADKILSEVGF